MSTAIKKPPPPGAASRSSANSPSGVTRSPSRSSIPTVASPTGVRRTTSSNRTSMSGPSPMSARSSIKKPHHPSMSKDSSPARDEALAKREEEEKAKAEETAALIKDLRDQLQKAESASDDYQKQVEVLKTRLDDALNDQAKLEERSHEAEERVDELENEKRETARQRRDLDAIYEAERAAAIKEKEQAQAREDELHEVIQRLKDTMAEREQEGEEDDRFLRRNSRIASPLNTRTNSSGNLEFAPPSSLQRSNSQNNSKLLLQKDKLIESLRLELAESQIKAIELENMGGGRMQELERILLETRMANARLMEDNESFQLLLSERTLNGDFSRGEFMRNTNAQGGEDLGGNSLADELGEAAEDEADTRRTESEITTLKDQNKALSLYINKIIERLLQHQGFEAVLSHDDNMPAKPSAANKDKELPPPPSKDGKPSFLQRAKSVALGANAVPLPGEGTVQPRPRPVSVMPPPSRPMNQSITDDPNTAPSIPLARGAAARSSSQHRRANSEWSNSASVVVNNMYRGNSPMSPSIVSPRTSFFGGLPVNQPNGPSTPGGSRVVSGSSSYAPRQSTDDASSIRGAGANPNRLSTNSKLDEVSNSDSGIAVDTPSPPQSVASSFDRPPQVIMGNKPRPLRLVQESEEADKERKAQNRQSWIGGWFSKNQQQQQHE
ncbi:uncharacterized protein K452DRAFT_293555 [Aplosporella prunicola CBS 121167]|uniref:Uncharacterized protein n=1 Tax=Aplosporella prunicola CBS 121167 TaxID=1176127 RepID=A0A6A6BUP7_9PEZI|nr:uncharacterized protein K452DRAFT_293555 [Aplosporella prunicola CBS 121167]KAF2147073.1 hypothetical protein K452DRAFT_293555 [Aplosporella prunicola CBS 121167]